MKRKKQGYNDRIDDSLGERNRGPKSQSLKDRRDESKAMEKKDRGHAYAGDREMDEGVKERLHHHMMKAHHQFMARHHKKKSYSK